MICKLTLILDEEMHHLSVKEDESILDAALDAGIDAPYSCQGGVCATCMAKVIDGAAKLTKNMVLTDSEIADGMILTCQAHPLTPTMTINYDDI